ncbi:MAG: demethoxyubiquinone hydroxylase family protein [Betaproteobacteria bacterium]|nr:demethoxyubiquinone hydroxylase family protein [Betaproteobacteria bacterium]
MPDSELGARILKVNHAGEHGAANIYQGQIVATRLLLHALTSELADFRAHEEKHRSIFWSELQRRGKPRCRSYHLCGIGGFVLGLITGLLRRQAIAATTVAVENVVLGHLQHQLDVLSGNDEAAVAAIQRIVDYEREHRDAFAARLEPGRFWPKVLTPIVAVSTETVIWLGMKL